MASTKYPIRTMIVPPWLSWQQVAEYKKQIYFNWRPKQRPAPASAEEKQHARLAESMSPVEISMDYHLLQFLKSIHSPIPLLIVHQGYGGPPVTTTVGKMSVFWSGEGLPRFDLHNDSETQIFCWGPLVLCVAPVYPEALEEQVDEPEERLRNPYFLEVIDHYGIDKARD